MARSRTIKPGFFTNDQLAELPAIDRLVAIGLTLIADREGRLEDRPKKIKAEILPYDDHDIDSSLDRLRQIGYLSRYTHQTEASCLNLIQITNFTKHQNPHMKEPPSSWPSTEQARCEHHTSTVLAPDQHQTDPANPDPNPLLSHDPPLPPTGEASETRSPRKKKPAASLARFDEWYDLYWRKDARGRAEKAWAALAPDDALVAQMIEATKRQTSEMLGREKRYQPLPATWINDKRWLDGAAPSNLVQFSAPKPEKTGFERWIEGVAKRKKSGEPDWCQVINEAGRFNALSGTSINTNDAAALCEREGLDTALRWVFDTAMTQMEAQRRDGTA